MSIKLFIPLFVFSFYEAVRDFKQKYNSTVEIRTSELISDAKAIFGKFIADDGKPLLLFVFV